MASTLTRATFRALSRPCLKRASCSKRGLHLTPIAQKKKSKVVVDDLFSEDAPEEHALFSATKTEAPTTSKTKVKSEPEVRTSKLTAEARLAQFTKTLEFVKPRIGRHPTEKLPRVRKSTWLYLVQLATTRGQLEQVVELVPTWNEGAGALNGAFSEAFVRRCEELSCPALALSVFGNVSKYNLRLTLSAARQLIHSLHIESPIQDTITAMSLYEVHGLPPAYKDLTSCSLVLVACFNANTKESLALVDALVPELQQLVHGTNVEELKLDSGKPRSLQKPVVWTTWALKRVQTGLAKVGEGKRDVDWLDVWKNVVGAKPAVA